MSRTQHQNSTRSKVRVTTTEVETTTSLAGTVGDKGVVMAMRVGVMMRMVVTTMRESESDEESGEHNDEGLTQ